MNLREKQSEINLHASHQHDFKQVELLYYVYICNDCTCTFMPTKKCHQHICYDRCRYVPKRDGLHGTDQPTNTNKL